MIEQENFFVQVEPDDSLLFFNHAFKSNFVTPGSKQILNFKNTLDLTSYEKWKNFHGNLIGNITGEISLSHLNVRQEIVKINWRFLAHENKNTTLLEGFGKIEKDLSPPVMVNKQVEAVVKTDYFSKAVELEKLINSSLDVICSFDHKGKFIKVSAACYKTWGYYPHELIGRSYMEFIHPDDVEKSKAMTSLILEGKLLHNYEIRNYRKSGEIITIAWSSWWDDVERKFYAVARDHTEKLLREAALQAIEKNYKLLFYNHPIPMWIYDVGTFRFIEVNESAIRNYGFTNEEFLQMTILDIRPEMEQEKLRSYHVSNSSISPIHTGYWIHTKKNGERINVEISANLISYKGRNSKIVIAIDRTEQVKAEEELLISNERFQLVSQATFEAIWDADLVNNNIMWNEGFTIMFGYEEVQILNRMQWWENHLHPEDKERVVKNLNEQLKTGKANWEDEYRYKCANGSYKYVIDRGFILYDVNNKPVRIIGAMQDLTERKVNELLLKELNASLEKRAAELATSNQDLERFAYVASHDLQEPLRMVSSFLELLQKRYGDKLDQKALEYIHYAVDGSQRMKNLILDLLEYSRVQSSNEEGKPVDTNQILQNVMRTFDQLLIETDGKIKGTHLPVVHGNKSQINQLFQNIIGNALKYRSETSPEINITSIDSGAFYEFCVSDNGIGIELRFFPKIFIIFQRLHNRTKYSGTGIGLAICKKIIEGHGGKIWLTSEPGVGSKFYFTLPKEN